MLGLHSLCSKKEKNKYQINKVLIYEIRLPQPTFYYDKPTGLFR